MGETIGYVVFVGFASLFGAIGLLLYHRDAVARIAVRRRLGRLRPEGGNPLFKLDQPTHTSVAGLLAESGLDWDISAFVGRITCAMTIGFLMGLVVGSLFLAIVLAGCGMFAIWAYVRTSRARRFARCDEQMPQALEIIAMGLRAGHALPRAIELAASEAPSPLNRELQRACDEHALGRPIGAVLEGLGQRLRGCEAVNTFVVAVLVLQQTGGNLISVIDRIVDNARERARYRARLRALTAEGRQSAKLLALMPGAFALLAMLSDPMYLDMLLHTARGRFIGLLAVALWLIGILWTRRLVRPMG